MELSSFNLCWTCWKSNQGYQHIKSDLKYKKLQKVIHSLLQDVPDTNGLNDEIHNLNIQILQLKMEILNLRCQQNIDPQLLNKLIRFCHPDKNPNREKEATHITQNLLNMREK